MNQIKFCDYCECETCAKGDTYLSTAKTINQNNICDVCYTYHCCTGATGVFSEECENMKCNHRPKLISAWKTFKEWKNNRKNEDERNTIKTL